VLSETDAFTVMASLPKEPLEDARKQSFWMVRRIHYKIYTFLPRKCTTVVECVVARRLF